jgi:hypothetical protein
VVSTVRVSLMWAGRQESRRAGQAAAGERCNRRDLKISGMNAGQIGQAKLSPNRR